MNIKNKFVRMILVRAFCEDEYGESICKNKWTHVNTKRIEKHFHKGI